MLTSKYSLISTLIHLLTQRLIRSAVLNFKTYVAFLVIFMPLNSNFIVVRKHMLYNCNALKFTDNLVLAQYVENVLYVLVKNVSSAVVGCNILHISFGRRTFIV